MESQTGQSVQSSESVSRSDGSPSAAAQRSRPFSVAALAALVLGLSVFAVMARGRTDSPERVSRAFVQAMTRGDCTAIYGALSTSFQQQASQADTCDRLIKIINGGVVTSAVVQSQDGDTASVKVYGVDSFRISGSTTIDLKKEGGKWKIDSAE